jgi:hypothetical protein
MLSNYNPQDRNRNSGSNIDIVWSGIAMLQCALKLPKKKKKNLNKTSLNCILTAMGCDFDINTSQKFESL